MAACSHPRHCFVPDLHGADRVVFTSHTLQQLDGARHGRSTSPTRTHVHVKASVDDGAAATATAAGRVYDASFRSVLESNLSDVSSAPSQNSRAVMAALRTLQDKIRRLTVERDALTEENTRVRREFAEV